MKDAVTCLPCFLCLWCFLDIYSTIEISINYSTFKKFIKIQLKDIITKTNHKLCEFSSHVIKLAVFRKTK